MADIDNLNTYDPFADQNDAAEVSTNLVHIRVQQRNNRKCLTTVSGLAAEIDFKKVLKALKKQFCCNGCIVEDAEHGKVIQLQGDQRQNCKEFILGEGLCGEKSLKVHGF